MARTDTFRNLLYYSPVIFGARRPPLWTLSFGQDEPIFWASVQRSAGGLVQLGAVVGAVRRKASPGIMRAGAKCLPSSYG
jgi:hypothetical protein